METAGENDVKALQRTLTQAVLSPGDSSEAIAATVKDLRSIASEHREKEMDTKTAVAAALDEGLRYAHNTGNFKAMLAAAVTDEHETVLDRITSAREIGKDAKLMAAKENFLEKVKLLSDSVATAKPADMEILVARKADVCDPAIFPFILAHASNPEKLEEGLLEAAGGVGTIDNFASQNIRAILEKHTVSDGTLFKAINASVNRASIPQFDVLAEKANSQNPALLDRDSTKARLLYQIAITGRDAQIDLRAAMIERLLEAGITPPPTVGGVNIINAMESEGFHPTLRDAVQDRIDSRDREVLRRSYRDIRPQQRPAEEPERKPRGTGTTLA